MISNSSTALVFAAAALLFQTTAHATPKAAVVTPAATGASDAVPMKQSPSDLPSKADIAAILSSAPTSTEYPNAAAATVLDESDDVIQPDGVLVSKVHEIERIFNDRGRSEADITIPYSNSNEKIEDLTAFTIRPNGTIIAVAPSDVHDQSAFSGYAMYDDSKVISFSMPAIEDGSIIDYSYKDIEKPLLPGDYSDKWWFNTGQFPVKLSRLTITAPAAIKLNVQLHNTGDMQPKIVTQPNGDKTYTYAMSNVADITAEPMMPPLRTIVPWMSFSTLTSWQDISHWYWGLAKDRMTITPDLHALVLAQTAGKTDDEDKAKALFYWVEQNIRYVGVELGQSAFQPHTPQSVYDNRYGDCKDMATLLVTLLRDAGIQQAYPVLLTPDTDETVADALPTPGAFDHCIATAMIDGKPYWFDCTAEICGFGDIPGGDRGSNVLVVKDGGTGEFQTVPSFGPTENFLNTTQNVVLNPDGSATCSSQMITKGDGDLSMRSVFRSIQPNLIQDGIRNIVSHESPNATLSDYKLSDIQDRDQPFSLTYSYTAPDYAQKTANLMIFSPQARGEGIASLVKPSRTYPIYAKEDGVLQTTVSVTIPDGYKVDDLPEDMNESLPWADYLRTTTQSGQTVTVKFQITQHSALVPATQYDALRAKLDKLREVITEPIVLKKSAAA